MCGDQSCRAGFGPPSQVVVQTTGHSSRFHFDMNVLEFTGLILLGSLLAGFLGALTGLGGGVVIVPMLAIFFGVDLRYAIGASLVSVIATSSGSAAAYVREGFSNIRIGMLLEVATTIGAIVGAYLVARVSTSLIAVIFGVVLLYSAYISFRKRHDEAGSKSSDHLAERLKLNGSFPDRGEKREYGVHRVPQGFGVMFMAGVLSGLLGIGSGAVKVLGMDQVMRVPFKVSTTTSNFMIGVTAAASAGIYLARGYIDPTLSLPVMLGVLTGSMIGARVLIRTHSKPLRVIFALVVLAMAIEMIIHGLTGRI